MRSTIYGRHLVLLLTGVVWLLAMRPGLADDPAFFETKVRPLLAERCYACHGEHKQRGGLRLDSGPGWQKGGESGPVIVPGNPEQSLLLKAVRWQDPALRMPPKEKLSAAEIATLEAWIKAGAPDPRTAVPRPAERKAWPEILAERRQWWSLQPVRPPAVPALLDPAWNAPVDRFLFHRLQQARIVPAALAPPATLVRRATLVLTGLPPTPEAVAAFERAYQHDPQAAHAALVDRLLASPQFGERFARHWLDVVRFTETHGNEWNYDVPHAWRYRDYVIRAFNDDVPYDQFVREHVAGDLLPRPRWNAAGKFNESAIGTAFYRFGEVNHDSCVEFGVLGYDIVDNQLDTLTKAFQATTVACARCHDHKLDAVSTADYHALLGILRSSRSVQRTLDGREVNADALAELRALKVELRAALAAAWQQESRSIDAAKLQALAGAAKDKAPAESSPLYPWWVACKPGTTGVAAAWAKRAEDHARQRAANVAFNQTHFVTLADFRQGVPAGWATDGMGLRDGIGRSGDLVVAAEGAAALQRLLPAGAFTFALSDKLNGALRSPTLRRSHTRVSFEVIGGRFSLARLVFNNCQLNYNHQHSLHHDAWSWVTVDFPKDTDALHPYAELLTYWDNPKFPDPLGTLGKDLENQRGPFAEHAKNPRTWWGVRRIVLHDGAETPKNELHHLTRLYAGLPPATAEEAAARYAQIAQEAVGAFAADRATDDDVQWLEWLRETGLLTNRADATPRLSALIARYRAVESRLALPTVMPGLADEGEGFRQPLLLRGDYRQPGEAVPRGYVQALTPKEWAWGGSGSGRRELAELIASPANPLTARVMANRVWLWVFGAGLVNTPDDFGHLGETPSHPGLLDYLAERLVARGWSIKALVRELVLSRAFQGDGAPTATARLHDPQNRLLAHYPARRGEAEVIRDSILAVAGRLDLRMFGPSIHPYRETADPEKRLFPGPLDGAGRRSLYLKFQLMEAPHFLRAFNLPGGKVTQGRRDATNNPAQSLALLNDPLVVAMADHWAGQLVRDGSESVAARVDATCARALGRPPGEAERERFVQAVRQLADAHHVAETDILTSRAVWRDLAHALFNLKEFLFIP